MPFSPANRRPPQLFVIAVASSISQRAYKPSRFRRPHRPQSVNGDRDTDERGLDNLITDEPYGDREESIETDEQARAGDVEVIFVICAVMILTRFFLVVHMIRKYRETNAFHCTSVTQAVLPISFRPHRKNRRLAPQARPTTPLPPETPWRRSCLRCVTGGLAKRTRRSARG